MLILIIRFMFVASMAGIGLLIGRALRGTYGEDAISWLPIATMGTGMVVATIIIVLDAAVKRKDISIISAVFFGLLVGLVVSLLLAPIVDMSPFGTEEAKGAAKIGIGLVGSYLAISFILQTRSDFRFVIPYIEFAKQQKGGRPMLLDTSVVIDGRIADIAETHVLDAPLVVPRFVLRELQSIADSSEKLKRNRGRRGLDILNRLQTMPGVDIRIEDATAPVAADEGVDGMLVSLAAETGARVVTNDYNLNKVARLRGVEVINLNDLANALKPAVLPGEQIEVSVLREGQEERQGVGYLEDGTMVVVEDGRDKIGETVPLTVTSVLQTSAGRMIFGRVEHGGGKRGR